MRIPVLRVYTLLLIYTQLQKEVYTFRVVEYSEGNGPEMNLEFQGIISFEYS